jgi:hypothetical protein
MIGAEFVYLGCAIALLGSASYVIDTARGRIQPNRVTYVMWSLAPLVTFTVQVREGIGIQTLWMLALALCPLSILVASFIGKGSAWSLTAFDLVCGALSFAGFLLYLATSVATLAVTFSVAADGLAALPTIRKAFLRPETESAWPYLTTAASAVLTLLTLSSLSFVNSAFSFYLLTVCLIIFALVKFRLGKPIAAAIALRRH